MSRSTITLLAAGAVLVTANLVVTVANPAPSASEPAHAESATGPSEACCLPQLDGLCIALGPETCLLAGGMPQGLGTICTQLSCLPGACCLPIQGELLFCIGDGLTQLVCEAIGGTFGGEGTKCINVGCTDNLCPSDVDGDGEVGIVDFLTLLADWGKCQ